MKTIELSKIETYIFIMRGQRVMLDFDLAKLYGVTTRRLNEQVTRNKERFPIDFMYEPYFKELEDLRSQFATANRISDWNHMRRSNLKIFTENGVAMLSSVLRSDTAIEINIAIMRVFTKLRSYLLMDQQLNNRLSQLEKDTGQLFRVVFERLDGIDEVLQPKLKPNRKKIGF